MKKLLLTLGTVLCLAITGVFAFDSYATANDKVSIFIDCGGLNSVRLAAGFDLINGENVGNIGSTVSTVWNMVEDPTSVDQDFIGWYVYDKATMTQIPGTGLMTTAQVNNYVIPNQVIKFVAQWTPRAGYPVKNITFAHFWNEQGEPCYDIRMSIIYGDTVYSGDGFVSIPESIYSTWSGNITYRVEPRNGVYTMYDGKWCNEVCEWEGTVKSFKKEKSLYMSASSTGKGRDNPSPRRKVNDWYYQMSFVAPEISSLSKNTADEVISDNTVVPATYTVATQVFESGASYDAALSAAQANYNTSNVVVVDITVKDDKGVNVTQLTNYVEVKVDIPSTYVIQPGNTVVVYYLNNSGVLEECETVYHDEDLNNRYVTFKTNHFSVYVLVEKAVKTDEKNDSDNEDNVDVKEESNTDINTEETTNELDDEPVGESKEETEEIVEETAEESVKVSNDEHEKLETINETGKETVTENKTGMLIAVIVTIFAIAVVVSVIIVTRKKK